MTQHAPYSNRITRKQTSKANYKAHENPEAVETRRRHLGTTGSVGTGKRERTPIERSGLRPQGVAGKAGECRQTHKTI